MCKPENGKEPIMEKKQPTKAELFEHVNEFLAKSEARDKTGRIVQYFMRCLMGLADHSAKDSLLMTWRPVFADIRETLAWARRTHRWAKEGPHIVPFFKAISRKDWLETMQRGVLWVFLTQDHLTWCLKVGIFKQLRGLSGKVYTQKTWHQYNLKFIMTVHVLNFLVAARAIKRIRDKEAKESPDEKTKAKNDKSVWDYKKHVVLRNVLTFIQISHVSMTAEKYWGFKHDDWYIGILGMISSYLDASKQW
jgi:hypothetical protein